MNGPREAEEYKEAYKMAEEFDIEGKKTIAFSWFGFICSCAHATGTGTCLVGGAYSQVDPAQMYEVWERPRRSRRRLSHNLQRHLRATAVLAVLLHSKVVSTSPTPTNAAVFTSARRIFFISVEWNVSNLMWPICWLTLPPVSLLLFPIPPSKQIPSEESG